MRWPALHDKLAAASASRSQAEWSAVFAGSEACVAPVVSLREAADHPHIKARGSIVEHEGPLEPAPAPRFSRTSTALGPPPAPGRHALEVLEKWGAADAASG
ncbi:CoA transferase [Nonomuraea wenchangensis]